MRKLTSGHDTELRAFREDDREGLIRLWSLSELLRPWNEPNHDIDAKVNQDPEGLIVMIEHERVIGSVMAGYDGHRGWINYFAVHPGRRSRGFGQLLMTAAEDHLSGLGCPKVNLQIRTTNSDVVHFYRRLGYELDQVVSMGKRLTPQETDPVQTPGRHTDEGFERWKG